MNFLAVLKESHCTHIVLSHSIHQIIGYACSNECSDIKVSQICEHTEHIQKAIDNAFQAYSISGNVKFYNYTEIDVHLPLVSVKDAIIPPVIKHGFNMN